MSDDALAPQLAAAMVQPPTEDEAALVADLIANHPPEDLALAALRLSRAAQDRTDHSRAGDDRSVRSSAPRGRDDFGPAVWFSLSVGQDGRAEARWLLPKLCEAGGIGRESIGAIRVRTRETFVQVAANAADKLPEGELERGLVLKRLAEDPTTGFSDRPTGGRADSPRGSGGPRTGGYGSARGGTSDGQRTGGYGGPRGGGPGGPRTGGFGGPRGGSSEGPRTGGYGGPRHGAPTDGPRPPRKDWSEDGEKPRKPRHSKTGGPRPDGDRPTTTKPFGRPERDDRPARPGAPKPYGQRAGGDSQSRDAKPSWSRPAKPNATDPSQSLRKPNPKAGARPGAKAGSKPGPKGGKPFGRAPAGRPPFGGSGPKPGPRG